MLAINISSDVYFPFDVNFKTHVFVQKKGLIPSDDLSNQFIINFISELRFDGFYIKG
jgi:hypothetical protein